MNDKKTKDQILQQNGALILQLEEYREADKSIRTYLSVSLKSGYKKKENHYDKEERYIYNWYEIFREIGKLLEKKDYVDLQEEIRNQQRFKEHILGELQEKFPDEFPRKDSY